MSNWLMMSIYLGIAVIFVVGIAIIAMRKEKGKQEYCFIFTTSMGLGWALCMVGYYASHSCSWSMRFYGYQLFFIALGTLGWFCYVIQFYGLSSYLPVRVVVALFAIPLWTGIVAVFPAFNRYLWRSLRVLQTTPAHIVKADAGPWFWVHFYYVLFLLVASLIIAIIQHHKIEQRFRFPSFLILLGSAITVMTTGIKVFVQPQANYATVGRALSVIILLGAMAKNKEMNLYFLAQENAFNCIDRVMFFLDHKKSIVTMNAAAAKWLELQEISYPKKTFLEIEEALDRAARRVEICEDEDEGKDYYLPNGEVYNLQDKCIYNEKEETMGYCIYITNETTNRKLVDELDQFSGMDGLTGLANRRFCNLEIERMIGEKQFPIGVIIGDVNDLKKANDELGHAQGDILLRVMGEAVIYSSPPKSVRCRIGGDEFMIVLPKATAEDCQEVVRSLRAFMQDNQGKYEFPLSMALGTALNDGSTGMETTIKIADGLMYADKEKIKAERNLSA
ncbi:diguanylate cyclase [Lachnospiraceae bacterium OttesenSCG-928-J05]|nr:diguanylate cyclase [Lachnospiraceae bacterium OttesenSCG-928-J05]